MFRCDRRCNGCDEKFVNLVGTKHTRKGVVAQPSVAIRHITRASLLTGMWRGQDNSNGQSSSKADCNQPNCQKKKKTWQS